MPFGAVAPVHVLGNLKLIDQGEVHYFSPYCNVISVFLILQTSCRFTFDSNSFFIISFLIFVGIFRLITRSWPSTRILSSPTRCRLWRTWSASAPSFFPVLSIGWSITRRLTARLRTSSPQRRQPAPSMLSIPSRRRTMLGKTSWVARNSRVISGSRAPALSCRATPSAPFDFHIPKLEISSRILKIPTQASFRIKSANNSVRKFQNSKLKPHFKFKIITSIYFSRVSFWPNGQQIQHKVVWFENWNHNIIWNRSAITFCFFIDSWPPQ